MSVKVPSVETDWWNVAAQTGGSVLGGVIGGAITVILTFTLIERWKHREEKRERFRQAAADFIAAAEQYAYDNNRDAITLNAISSILYWASSERNTDPKAKAEVPKALELRQQERQANEVLIKESFARLCMARAKILVMLDNDADVQAFEKFFDYVSRCSPPLREGSPNNSSARQVDTTYTIQYIAAWTRKQSASLANKKNPRFNFDMSDWK